MYKYLQLHGNTVRFTPQASENKHKINKVTLTECVKQISFEYVEASKREYIELSFNFDEDNVLIPDSETEGVKEVASTITEKYRIVRNRSHHWDDTEDEYTIENSYRYTKYPKVVTTITKESPKEVLDKAKKANGIVYDITGTIVIIFHNDSGEVMGTQTTQQNLKNVSSRDISTSIELLYKDIYNDIDLFFGVSAVVNEDCYVKEDTDSKAVNVLWPLVR